MCINVSWKAGTKRKGKYGILILKIKSSVHIFCRKCMFFSFLSRKLMVNILQTKMCTGRNQGSKVYYLPSGFRSNCAAGGGGGGGAPAAGGGARTGTGFVEVSTTSPKN